MEYRMMEFMCFWKCFVILHLSYHHNIASSAHALVRGDQIIHCGYHTIDPPVLTGGCFRSELFVPGDLVTSVTGFLRVDAEAALHIELHLETAAGASADPSASLRPLLKSVWGKRTKFFQTQALFCLEPGSETCCWFCALSTACPPWEGLLYSFWSRKELHHLQAGFTGMRPCCWGAAGGHT